MNVQVMVEKTEQTNCDVFQKDFGVHRESSESSEHSKLCWRSSSALTMDLSALRAVLRLTASKWATNQRRDPAKSGSDQKISHRGGQNSSWYRISVGILKSQSRTQQGNELLVSSWSEAGVTGRVERLQVLKYLHCSDGLGSSSAQDCWPQELKHYQAPWRGPHFDQHLPGVAESWQPSRNRALVDDSSCPKPVAEQGVQCSCQDTQ